MSKALTFQGKSSHHYRRSSEALETGQHIQLYQHLEFQSPFHSSLSQIPHSHKLWGWNVDRTL